MKKMGLIFLLCLFGCISAQDTGALKPAADWVIWLDGTHYSNEWSWALEAVLDVMKPGESGLVIAPEVRHQFFRENGPDQLESLIGIVRPSLEQGANRFTQLLAEMQGQASRISTEESSLGDIKGYLLSRKQLLNMYAEGQKKFWSDLSAGLLMPGARLVVLVQQFDVPAVKREILESLRENKRLREWVLDLQDTAPFEEDVKHIKTLADMIMKQKNRVDSFYIKFKERGFRGTEVSRAFFNGVARLCKAGGGVAKGLNSNPRETAALLMK